VEPAFSTSAMNLSKLPYSLAKNCFALSKKKKHFLIIKQQNKPGADVLAGVRFSKKSSCKTTPLISNPSLLLLSMRDCPVTAPVLISLINAFALLT
jgi:hypothetical protein